MKNVSNTANWLNIVNALKALKTPQYLVTIIQDYLSNRVLIYNTELESIQYNVIAAVPQGAVLGSLFVTARTLEEIQIVANAGIGWVKSWLNSMGLALAEHKTKAVFMFSRKEVEFTIVHVENCEIKTQLLMKYLGVILDNRT